MVETVMAEAEVLREKEDVTTTGVPALQKTGQNLFHETKESKQSSSVSTLNFSEITINFLTIFNHQICLLKSFPFTNIPGAGGHEPSGINFDRYEDIPVEATGSDVPAPIEDVSLTLFLYHRSTFKKIRSVI